MKKPRQPKTPAPTDSPLEIEQDKLTDLLKSLHKKIGRKGVNIFLRSAITNYVEETCPKTAETRLEEISSAIQTPCFQQA